MSWLEALRDTAWDYEKRWPGFVVWGEMDCCQFVNDYYQRANNKRFDFQYESEFGAGRVLAKHGGMEGLFRSLLGEPGELQPGSIVVTETDSEPAAGVFNGYCVWLVHPEKGIGRVQPNGVIASWPVQ